MRLTPKMSERPAATRNSELAPASPFRNCSRTAELLTPASSVFPQGADFLVGGLEFAAVGVAPIHHDALSVLPGELPHVRAHRRLMVDGAPDDRAERRGRLETLQRFHQLLGVGRLRLFHR